MKTHIHRWLCLAWLGLASVSVSGCGLFCSLLGNCKNESQSPTAPTSATASSRILAIAPVAQQTPEWCWLASSQMIFQYYGVPAINNGSYQCGIMGTIAGPSSICFYNCALCAFGAGSTQQAALVLQQYPAILQQYFFPPTVKVPQLTATVLTRQLSMAEVQQQIDAGHPVALGITVGGPFTGIPGHEVVLVGYVITATGQSFVVIDDPFPYDTVVGPSQNPYYQLGGTALQPGQYQLLYSTAGPGLQWSVSIETSLR